MKKTLLIATLAALFSAQSANAADGVINFTGNVTDTACTVDSASANQTVDLGTVSTSAFSGAGSTASPTRFTISLTTCPVAANSAKVRFDGKTAAGNSAIIGLNSGQTAGNIGVAIYEDNSSTLIPVGSPSAAKTLTSTGVNEMTYIAKYMATGTSVSAGSANATATFTITYL
ncbi:MULTISPECIES: fimbrial protein [unclassified Serratia (in: enterobacteria)]|uniref:fimbrial protein n=1 Tax=unclassified Serratia (in: enterobacteria) TaxID=2647522 RepID=UPI0005011A2E|nr:MULTISPECIES: fimbrial protein [unclassified Serratia (in: enterobacteria)]KFK92345.1 fimbrial protein [Serratia sp. Ag2]KFL00019.1 fimbrial protein [Serratia sp. Ag1]